MPCTDGGAPYPPTEEELLEAKVPAMLCAVLNALTAAQYKVVVARIDWAEAGVTRRELARWFLLHQKRDKARQKAEAAKRERKALRAAARKKLSPAELAAILETD